MRASLGLLVVIALLACKSRNNDPPPTPAPDPAPIAPATATTSTAASTGTECTRLGAYYTLNGGVAKGGVNISCDGKCEDVKELEDGAKLKLGCHVNCNAIGTQASKFAGAMNVNLDLSRSDKDPNRYAGTISDGKSAPDAVSLEFKQKYTEANGQMTERDMRWSMTLRPCK